MSENVSVRFYPIFKMAKELADSGDDLFLEEREMDEIQQIQKVVMEVSSEPPTFTTTAG